MKCVRILDTFDAYPENLRPDKPLKFYDILPISAKEGGEAIQGLKDKLRKMLDILFDQQTEDNAKLLETIQDLQKERGPMLV